MREEKKCYRLLSNGGYKCLNIGDVYELHSYSDGGVRLKIPYTGNVLHFHDSEVEEVVNEKPERYASREVKTDPVVMSVMTQLLTRSQLGISKYGTTLEDNNTDDFLQHLKEELMDAILYIEKLQSQK